jgi:hypothetical protein
MPASLPSLTGPNLIIVVTFSPCSPAFHTQIPFGDTKVVEEWMKITGPIKHVNQPLKKGIRGMLCTLRDPSGTRFWNFISNKCGTAEDFFRVAFVRNYCPVAFTDSAGRNRTPDHLKVRITYDALFSLPFLFCFFCFSLR